MPNSAIIRNTFRAHAASGSMVKHPRLFDMAMERVANPKGDRVKITMSGKFLPYKYYGASGNVPEYGFKEE